MLQGGTGKGYPEFIIEYKDNPDFLIVVECKAVTKYHKSDTEKKYKDYAVDGVKLYSSFLSKEYDVLSIAISGENEKEKNISHFLQLKGTDKTTDIFNDDKFLPLNDYIESYDFKEKKFNQDLQELLKYSKELNDKLQSFKIPESNRSLLISGCLIALQDKAFNNSYNYQKPQDLTTNLLNTIESRLTEVVNNKDIKDIITSYQFIKTHTILSRKKNSLRDIITEVDERINVFMKTYTYYDTLGQFYIEFLRYANNDKGLGIVLTPPHITELFSEIANVNKDSVVYDNCTGTGGFLISAMDKMIKDASGDKEKEAEIKNKQLIGVEFQHSIYALVCSNMYIHGDGRSNLIKGSCFEEEIIKKVKEFKPNVGFLNPPYADKKHNELEFILNNLLCFEKGAYCLALVPMSCALSQKGEELLFKEQLLKNHTLEGVFSMPTGLFHNSKVGINTCVMMFKANEKHPENYKTYFGYWKNDGFTKKKHTGRGDYNHQWSKIKKKWLENYRNKEEIAGLSIKKIVKAKDEWCVEAYMKTDYKLFNESFFSKSIHNFISFQFNIGNIKDIKNNKISNKKIDLLNKNWKYFSYKEIFNKITRGKRLVKVDREDGNVLYYSASEFNNGCTGSIGNPLFTERDCLIYTTFGDAYYVKGEFTASDEISILSSENLNILNGLFLSTIISQNKYKYSFGRKAFKNKYYNDFIALPVDKYDKPDWKFMEDYIKSLPYSSNI